VKILLAGLLGGSSGIERYTRILAQELTRLGHAVAIVDASGGRVTDVPQGAAVASIPRGAGRVSSVPSVRAYRASRVVNRIADDVGADVVHVTHVELLPATGRRLIVTAWDPEMTVLGRARAARRRGLRVVPEAGYAMIDRAACRRADAVIAVSHEVDEALSGSGRRVAFIPPFLPDEQVETPLPARGVDCVLVANGIESPRKGLDLAIAAVGRARKAGLEMRLVLIGSWHDPRRIDTLPEFCDAWGRVPQHQVRAALRGAGCCIVPSRWEEFGYAGLEALAAGTPVVCGRLPGLTGLGTTGVLAAQSRDPAAFASRLLEAVALREFRYPSEARASCAVPRLLDVYSHRSATASGATTAAPSGQEETGSG
jgi:glycosyltransferase involved in cell wall biosynthesis